MISRQLLVNAPHQPSSRMRLGREYHVVLKNVVKVDVPAISAVKNRDRTVAVDARPELILGLLAYDVHRLPHDHNSPLTELLSGDQRAADLLRSLHLWFVVVWELY
jgi:hypothetical protein